MKCNQCGAPLVVLSEWFDEISELWIDEWECRGCGALFLYRRRQAPDVRGADDATI